MRLKLLLAALLTAALFCFGQASRAQFAPSIFVHGTSGGGYSGPCDKGVTCKDGWGAQRVTSAYTGPLINACIIATPTTCADIGYDASGGLDTTALSTLGCSGDTTCGVKTEYSQLGTGCNLTQSSSTNWAKIRMTTTENGHVSLNFVGTDSDIYTCTYATDITDATYITMVSGTSVAAGVTPIMEMGLDAGCGDGSGLRATTGNPTTISAATFNGTCTVTQSSGVSGTSGTFMAYAQVYTSFAQATVNSTSDTANTGGTPFATEKRMTIGGVSTGIAAFSGEIDVAIFVAPHTATPATIAGPVCAFWQATPTC